MRTIIIIVLNLVYQARSLVDFSCLHSSAWILNTNGHRNSYFSSAYTDINSSKFSGTNWTVYFNSLPNYDRNFTTSDIETLNSRPLAADDFDNGATTASAGKYYVWGTDIGYALTPGGCNLGYWPPGPACPSAMGLTKTFSLNPSPEQNPDGCETDTGATGYLVNGVAVYNYGDGTTYNSEGAWSNNAYVHEIYDLDVCLGHSDSEGQYHHHNFSPCLQDQLGDYGTGHSPVYGFALDSYPIYGPYQAANTLAVSCWQKRDYSSTSPTGCSDGKRSCQLTDQWDYTQGTTSVTMGPDFTDYVTSLSGNSILASIGAYKEDFFYNSTCGESGGIYLNDYNGHSHDSYGFHYHITINASGIAQFPYQVGPKYYGCRFGTRCSGSTGKSNCGSTSGTTTYSCKTASSHTSSPSPAPSKAPTPLPSLAPTVKPTTGAPTSIPTISQHPTASPTSQPSSQPSGQPTSSPSAHPTFVPTSHPTSEPTRADLIIRVTLLLSGLTSSTLSTASQTAILHTTAISMGVNASYLSISSVTALNVLLSRQEQISRRFLASASVGVTAELPMDDFTSTREELYASTVSSLATAITSGTYTSLLRNQSTALGATETVSITSAAYSIDNAPTHAPSAAPQSSSSGDDFVDSDNYYIMIALVGFGVLVIIGVSYCYSRRICGGSASAETDTVGRDNNGNGNVAGEFAMGNGVKDDVNEGDMLEMASIPAKVPTVPAPAVAAPAPKKAVKNKNKSSTLQQKQKPAKYQNDNRYNRQSSNDNSSSTPRNTPHYNKYDNSNYQYDYSKNRIRPPEPSASGNRSNF